MRPVVEHSDSSIIPHPRAPRTIEECGLPFDLLVQLIVKTLHFSGDMSGAHLSRTLGLHYSVIESVLHHLKLLHLVEVTGGGLTAGPAFSYRLTDAGRMRALLFLEQSQYVGVAPVPFAEYDAYMTTYAEAIPKAATRERVREAFRGLVLSQRVLDQLGPAVNGNHSIFVYGPPGNGKTVISQAIRNLLEGELAIPRAIVSDGHVIKLYDPAVHEPLPLQSRREGIDIGDNAQDERWVRCRRPLIMVGGELELKDLDLSFSPIAKFYQAPIQLTANGGVLVIDDFGRQKCSPVALLNRWITPLESRVDYLTLQTGQKLSVPFVVLVVLATNIKPADLVDEAFMRRIRYKVFAESPSTDDFKLIFRRCCAERDIPYDEALVDSLIREVYEPRGLPIRGSHPRDLIDHALSRADYLSVPRELNLDLLQEACASYFVDEEDRHRSSV
jgi:predicted ATPase with chaperone activity